MSESALEILNESYNKIILDGSFHECWKEYVTVLIPKNGKKDFKPISLESCILKIFEKLIKIRLDWKGLLSLTQYYQNASLAFVRVRFVIIA